MPAAVEARNLVVAALQIAADDVRRQRSYYEVSRLDRRGDVYIARAEDRRGRDIRITADAYTGRVIDVDYIRRDRDRDRWDDRHDRRWR